MNILQQIVSHKRDELTLAKAQQPEQRLLRSGFFDIHMPLSMRANLEQKPIAIIAEHKRKSPSKGWFAPQSDAPRVVSAYHQAGAAAASVLTDERFFGGSLDDLAAARRACGSLPLLRKDFIIDPYQLIQARASGADAVLLIAEILTAAEVRMLAEEAHRLGLEVLLELHNPTQRSKVWEGVDMLGINNRNLHSFEENVERSAEMLREFGVGFCLISESGIRSVDRLVQLHRLGFDGFLIGEYLMRCGDPAAQLGELLQRAEQQLKL